MGWTEMRWEGLGARESTEEVEGEEGDTDVGCPTTAILARETAEIQLMALMMTLNHIQIKETCQNTVHTRVSINNK